MLTSQKVNIVMEEGSSTVYLMNGYEMNEEDLTTLLQEPVFNKYNTIARNGLAAALKEYYAATTNVEKVLILKSILDNIPFVELKRFSRGGCRLFGMCQSENDLPSSDEFPGNLSLARKLMANGYDVYMPGNPNGIRSADFIVTKKNMVYYLEGKTFNGTNTLDHLLSKAARQADRIVVDIVVQTEVTYLSSIIKLSFVNNTNLNELVLFKGSRMIITVRQQAEEKQFERKFRKIWAKTK